MNHDFTLKTRNCHISFEKQFLHLSESQTINCIVLYSHCSKNCYRCSPQQLIRETFEYIRRSTSAAAAFTASWHTENLDANHAFT